MFTRLRAMVALNIDTTVLRNLTVKQTPLGILEQISCTWMTERNMQIRRLSTWEPQITAWAVTFRGELWTNLPTELLVGETVRWSNVFLQWLNLHIQYEWSLNANVCVIFPSSLSFKFWFYPLQQTWIWCLCTIPQTPDGMGMTKNTCQAARVKEDQLSQEQESLSWIWYLVVTKYIFVS